jgi:hypothetical protein
MTDPFLDCRGRTHPSADLVSHIGREVAFNQSEMILASGRRSRILDFESAAVGLDLPSIRNLIGDQGLRRQFLRGMGLISRMRPFVRHISLMMIGLVTCARLEHASAETGAVNGNRQRLSIAVPDFSSTSDDGSWSASQAGAASGLRRPSESAFCNSLARAATNDMNARIFSN